MYPYPLVDDILGEEAKTIPSLGSTRGADGFNVTRDHCWEDVAPWVGDRVSRESVLDNLESLQLCE